MASDDVVIKMEAVWKRYGLPLPTLIRSAYRRFRSSRGACRSRVNQRVLGHSQTSEDECPWALRNINLQVRRGETLGIVGRNGASKSTLLKILAGVTPPSHGRVEVRGRVFPMIELNAGIHPELTGRENARLLGAIMGISRREIERKMPDIEEFTELGDWFDQPVRMYSSGMLSRLGFGVATNIQSDILLIDEVFSVGDLKFQNKSLARIKQMRESGTTILLVTHSLDTLQFIAERSIVLEDGEIVAEGPSLEALCSYEKLVFHSEQRGLRHGDGISIGEVTIHNARVYGPDGRSTVEIAAGSPFGVEIDIYIDRKLERPVFSLGIRNASGVLCVWNISDSFEMDSHLTHDGFQLRAWYPDNKLMNGAYEVQFTLQDGSSFETIERVAGVTTFSIVGDSRARGIVAMSPRWELAARGQRCESRNGHRTTSVAPDRRRF